MLNSLFFGTLKSTFAVKLWMSDCRDSDATPMSSLTAHYFVLVASKHSGAKPRSDVGPILTGNVLCTTLSWVVEMRSEKVSKNEAHQ
jgi:hypothetical protein